MTPHVILRTIRRRKLRRLLDLLLRPSGPVRQYGFA